MHKSGIYKITNSIDDRIYIGSSIKLTKRINEHIRSLRSSKHRNPHLQKFVDKYGLHSLIFEIIEYCAAKNLLLREQYYLDLLKPEFNISPTAGNTLGVKMSEETKALLSRIRKGKPKSESFKIKISQINKQKVVSDATRKKISEAKKGIKIFGRICTKETLEKMSNSQKGNTNRVGKSHTDETRKKMKEAWELRKQSGYNYGIGRKNTEQAKANMRAAWIKRKQAAITDIIS